MNGIVAVVITLLIGGAATAYLLVVARGRKESDAGIAALAAMSWREFIHLVLGTLERRGYSVIVDRDAPSSSTEYLLGKDGQRWLMSCKHGSAFVLGAAAVSELAEDIRLRSATGGILVTQGRVDDDARPAARHLRIELLDGPTLWPQVRELLPEAQLARIRSGASQQGRRGLVLAWSVAIASGIAAFILLPAPVPKDPAAAQGVVQTPAPRPAAAVAAAEAAPGRARTDELQPLPDAETLERQRKDLARAISTLPMVDRAAWPTNSTIEVILLETVNDAIPLICPLVERYPGLAASRIQLTPPPGSEAPVRFRQCRAY